MKTIKIGWLYIKFFSLLFLVWVPAFLLQQTFKWLYDCLEDFLEVVDEKGESLGRRLREYE